MTKEEFVTAAKPYYPGATYQNIGSETWEAVQFFYTAPELDELLKSNLSSLNHRLFAGWVKANEARVLTKKNELSQARIAKLSALEGELNRIKMEIRMAS